MRRAWKPAGAGMPVRPSLFAPAGLREEGGPGGGRRGLGGRGRREGASAEQLRVCGEAAAADFFEETRLEAEIPAYSWRCEQAPQDKPPQSLARETREIEAGIAACRRRCQGTLCSACLRCERAARRVGGLHKEEPPQPRPRSGAKGPQPPAPPLGRGIVSPAT